MKFLVVVFVIVSLTDNVSDVLGKVATIPKEFTLCPRTDNNSCLLKAVSGALKFLKPGNSKLGVQPLDPLHVKRIVMNQGSGSVRINLELKNLDIMGLGDLAISSVKGEFGDKTYRLEVQGKCPVFTWLGDYDANGQILVLPVRGNGKANFTYIDVDLNAVITGHVVKKDGVDFVNIDNFVTKFNIKRMYTHYGNLFNGDKRLGEAMNAFLNDNWKLVLEEVQPIGEKALGDIMKGMAKRFYERVPYRKVHP